MLLKEARDLSTDQLRDILKDGGKVVAYAYTISILIMTFKRSSELYLYRSGENRVQSGLFFSLITLLLGWWGIPWGPIYSIQSLWQNFSGGIDVTKEILAKLEAPISEQAAPVEVSRVTEEGVSRTSDQV